MLKVALTGGIGSGKSAIAELFAQRSIAIIDTDIIARKVVLPTTEAWRKILDHFGPEVLLADQTLNRAWLRQKIFAEPVERKWLESLLHPLIRAQMIKEMDTASSPYCIVVIPLLTATSHPNMFDRILVVTAELQNKLPRIMARDNITLEQAKNMIAAQITDHERLAFADDIINNNCSSAELAAIVDKMHQFYLKLAQP